MGDWEQEQEVFAELELVDEVQELEGEEEHEERLEH